MIHDGWTTKNNIHAFIGAAVAYIDENWTYQVRHLTMKPVAWHHQGKWLAQPVIHFMIKHGLHTKISFFFPFHVVFTVSPPAYLVLLLHMVGQITDSGSNNLTMAREMDSRFVEHEVEQVTQQHHSSTPLRSTGGKSYTWNPLTDHARCFLHNLALVVKAGLK